MARIYIGNLLPGSSEMEIRNLFEEWGKVVSVELAVNRRTGMYSSYGFVEMEDEEAEQAIRALDGMKMGGQAIRVSSLVGC